MTIANDERAIRQVVATWMEASMANDVPRVLELMADDVVFIGVGRPPMRGREQFAAAMRSASSGARMEGGAEVQEVRVFGDWAYSWVEISATMRGADGSVLRDIRGPALSVLRREPDGRWVIFRDANMTSSAPRTDSR